MDLNDREKTRQEGYKTGISSNDNRRRREETTVSIRKNKKSEQMKKRRNIGAKTQDDAQVAAAAGLCLVSGGTRKIQKIAEYMEGMTSGNVERMMESTMMFRKLLSIDKNPPIEEVIKAGAVPGFVEFLKAIEYPKLQFEAAWALTNITSTDPEYTQVVIESGAVPVLVELLKVQASDVREQAAWCLGNIAGDNVVCRDYVLQFPIMEGLLLNLNHEDTTIGMLRTSTWVLSNLCRGKPQPQWNAVSSALPTLGSLIQHEDTEVLTDALWALSYLSDGPDENIQDVLNSGVVQIASRALTHPKVEVKIPALRTIGNIVTGNDGQTQAVIDLGILKQLKKLLHDDIKANIRKEACWTIANVTAGSIDQIQEVFDNGIVMAIIHILKTCTNFKTKKEAAWVISNITSGGSHQQIRELASCGACAGLSELLHCSDPRIILVAMEGISNILEVGQHDSLKTGTNLYINEIDECGALEKLDKLQDHAHKEVYQKAGSILDMYFSDEGDDENTAPVENNRFAFNAPTAVPNSGFAF